MTKPSNTTKKNVNVLLIYPGARWDLKMGFEHRLTGYSEGMQGTVITTSGEDSRLVLGNFHIIALSLFSKIKFFATLRYFYQSIRFVLKTKRGDLDLVVGSDPLKAGLIAWIAARLSGAKCLVEINGDFTNWSNYSDIKSPTMRRFKRSSYLCIIKFVLKHVDGIRQLYPTQLDYFADQIKDTHVATLFDFSNVDNFQYLEDQKEILVVGYPLYVKGIDIAIQAFEKVQYQHPEWKLKILGWYTPEKDPDFFQWIEGNDQIIHHEPVLHNEMPGHIGRCGIYLLSSRTEGIPRILIEAMYSRKAIIASDVGGVATMFDDGKSGFIFPPEDTEQLSQLLDELMSDNGLRHHLASNAEENAKQIFNERRFFSETLELYRKIAFD